MQKKSILIVLLLIILSSYFVYAYSAKEFLQDYKELITGKAVQENKGGLFEEIVDFFKSLFGKKNVGADIRREQDKEVSQLNEQLVYLNEKYQQIYNKQNLDELVEINNKRKQKTIELMQKDPNEALKLVFDENERNKFPLEVQKDMEEKIVQEGKLEIRYADDFENPKNSKYYYDIIDDNFNKINVYPNKNINLVSNSRVEINGYKLENNLLVDVNNENLQILSLNEKAEETNENLGEQRTIVILMDYVDENNVLYPTISREDAQKAIFEEANDYYKENSYGKTWLTGNIVGPYKTTKPCSEYESIKLADKDVNFQNYERIIIFYPLYLRQNNICNIGGWGYDGISSLGKNYWSTEDGLISASYSLNLRKDLWVTGHELGHQFGVMHANLLDCNNLGYFEPDLCNLDYYGDPFDIMGNEGTRSRGLNPHLNAYNKEVIGYLSEEEIINQIEGEFDLKPIELGGDGIKLIKIPMPNKIYEYSLEYRQPIGFDKDIDDKLYDGVLLHITMPWHGADTSLYYPKDITIKPGEVFEDHSDNDVKIKVLSAYGSYAKVNIESKIQPFSRLDGILIEPKWGFIETLPNTINTIKLSIHNTGVIKAENIIAKLYRYEFIIVNNSKNGATEYIEELLSEENFGNLDAGEYKIIGLRYNTDEPRYNKYLIKINSENNFNEDGIKLRFTNRVSYEGAYLSLANFYLRDEFNTRLDKPPKVNQKILLIVDIYNQGLETAQNSTLSIYEAERTCNPYGCNYQPIGKIFETTRDLFKDLNREVFYNLEYTPRKSGKTYLTLELNHPNNRNPQKEFYYEFDVQPNKRPSSIKEKYER